ncbi:MAG: hypothetical protein NZM26_02575 [Patescibacteria group bacterium]|nr:hypothetical protein [Patescibacteria group bacterium]
MKSKNKTLSNPNPVGPGFRTPSAFRASIFSKGNGLDRKIQTAQIKSNQLRKTQHKG